MAANRNRIAKVKANRLAAPTESSQQIMLAEYLDKRNVLFFSIPNGSSRTIAHAMLMKRTGMKKGVPDIFVPVACNGFHGLFLELKRGRKMGAALSDAQKWWLQELNKQGYKAICVFGFDEAVAAVNEYFSRNPPTTPKLLMTERS